MLQRMGKLKSKSLLDKSWSMYSTFAARTEGGAEVLRLQHVGS